MNARVEKLRTQSVETRPYLSSERAELMTAFYKGGGIEKASSVVVGRAAAFQHFMANRTICINEGELIVGERGPAPKATPTYPELCCHSLEDLRIISSRERTRFAVSDGSRAIQSMVLTAWDEGIGSNWVGFMGPDEVKPVLGIPDDRDLLAIVPFGYPAQTTGKGKKQRKPIDEVVFAERFGQTLK